MYKLYAKSPLSTEFVLVGKSAYFDKAAGLGSELLGWEVYIENSNGVKYNVFGRILR